MSQPKQKPSTAESLWGVANELRNALESGQLPDETKLAAYAIALSILATDVEKLTADRDAKDQRLKNVITLCSRAEREGITGGGKFTVASVRAAAEQ